MEISSFSLQAVFVAIVAVVYGAESPIKVRQVVINPTIQPIIAGINPYYRQPIHTYQAGHEAAARILTQQQDASPDGSGYAYS